ncbi:MAG: type I-C CRISPR-associated protein Cas8c/Csd1, partial [Acetatifactor sp.]|nr:type I-C CRISPR-associated protein Cas8c/Csd1 [Acetatifactor sp.]
LERSALSMGGGKEAVRNTAAEKYFVLVQISPGETWNTIRSQLNPYVMKLRAAGREYYIDRMDQLTARLELVNRDKLEPTFLQGYSCQIMEYRGYFKKEEHAEEEGEAQPYS